jgi:hypothetical protein
MLSCQQSIEYKCVRQEMFDEVRDVREWMAVAYKPELAATLGSCMQDMMHCLKAGLEGQPNVTPATY